MLVNISKNRGPYIYHDDTLLSIDDLYAVAPESFLRGEKMLINLKSIGRSFSDNRFLGYVSVYYTNRIFAGPNEEAQAVREEIRSVNIQIAQAENKRTAAIVSPLPFLAIKYVAQIRDLRARLTALSGALVTLNEQMSQPEQAERERIVLTQVFQNPAGGIDTIKTAEDLIAQRRAEYIVQQAAIKKPNTGAAAFLIPAAIGAGLGLFL